MRSEAGHTRVCSEGYLHLDSNHHRQEFLFQFPEHCQLLQGQATQPARHRVPTCSTLPRYTAQLPGQHSYTWVSYERLDGNTREESRESQSCETEEQEAPRGQGAGRSRAKKTTSHPGLAAPIPCCPLHEAGMNSSPYPALKPLRYMETSSAYLWTAPDEPPGSPAGLCTQL